jgi:threonine dehydrogenase-like Zn-dependent dehydrogenase
MAEYMIWRPDQLFQLPESASLPHGCLSEPVSVRARMVDKLRPKTGDQVLACGAGPTGLNATRLLARAGGDSADLVEPAIFSASGPQIA